MLVQAMLGLVSPALRGVAVEFDGDMVTLHVAVAVDSEINADLDDLVADLEGLLWPRTPHVNLRVFAEASRGGWEGGQHRLVYLAKGW